MTPTARMCSTAALCAVICVGAPVFLQFVAPTRGLRGAAGAAGATGATPTAPSFGSTVGILGTTMAVGAVAAVARASKVDGGGMVAGRLNDSAFSWREISSSFSSCRFHKSTRWSFAPKSRSERHRKTSHVVTYV